VCGLVCQWSWRAPVDEALIRAALQRLSHRGPDDEGLWISHDQRLALGHRRLAIVGVSDGQQPITNEDGKLQIIVNGEFYDDLSLRAELRRHGHRFRTESDSEVALHLYEDHGLDFLSRLRGEFALVLWDSRRNRLVAARDRFGIKPLVYCQTDHGLWLASEAKALFALGVPADWDHSALLGAMAVQYVAPDRTLFRNIRQIPPGCVMVASEDSLQIDRYWDLPEADLNPSVNPEQPEELVARCRQAVIEAVRLRLRADVPVCVQLSGGIDSTAVLGIAASQSSSPLHAYSVTFDQLGYDESSMAVAAANHCGAILHKVHVQPADILQHLSCAVGMSEGLCINGHLVAKFLLHRAIHADGFKAVLTGEGADEAFHGYAHLRIDYWRSLGRADLESTLASSNRTSLGMMLPHGESLDLTGVLRRLGYVPAWMQAKATMGARLFSLLRDDLRHAFVEHDHYGELVDSICGSPPRHAVPVVQSNRLWIRSALANYILKTLGDGTEMAHSVEGRVPFLDHHLWEFLGQVPLDQKIRGTTEKHILREAMRGFVPESIRTREKHPFDAPPVSLTSLASADLRDHFQSRLLEQQPLFDADRLMTQLDSLQTKDESTRLAWDPVFMTVLSVLALQEHLNRGFVFPRRILA